MAGVTVVYSAATWHTHQKNSHPKTFFQLKEQISYTFAKKQFFRVSLKELVTQTTPNVRQLETQTVTIRNPLFI